ncbi:Rho GTPase activating protein, partial [Teratosphaeriaceae sp. CCFEE 6253]
MSTPTPSHALGWQHESPQSPPTTARTARKAARPVPSPLQESTVARSASDLVATGPLSPATPSSFTRAAYSQDRVATSTPAHPLPADRVRAPNPAKRAPTSPAIEEFRSAVTLDALRDEARQAAASAGQSRNVSAPVLPAHAQPSPPTSPTTMPAPSAPSRPAHRAELRAIDGKPAMPRTASLDSTVSTVSNATTASQRPNGGGSAHRVNQESAGAEDVAALIAGAGSAEAAVQKLLGEKSQAASHNAQLWRLVEKQRAMILGLNKDLEKSLKEKERYRRKLKDHLVESQSAPVLPSASRQADEKDSREASQSPAPAAEIGRSVGASVAASTTPRGFSYDSRKVSDASDVASIAPGRSDTPQDIANPPSSGTLPGTPLSTSSGSLLARESDSSTAASSTIKRTKSVAQASRPVIEIVSMISKPGDALKTPLSSTAQQKSPIIPSPGGKSLSSPKTANRKAPPAPLQLSPKSVSHTSNLTANNIVDASDSEYEEDPDSARAEYELRGRRKTREEDDQEREAVAKQEEEYRSRSTKQSKSKTPAERTEHAPDAHSLTVPQPAAVDPTPEPRFKTTTVYPANTDPASIVRQRALSDAARGLPKSVTAPSLLSPGLPMSPRPSDKPLNSPLPRAPKPGLSSIPMSPRVGLPLSPRAPRQPLPLPPQTPLSLASPHLARAEQYHHHHQRGASQQNAVADALRPSPEPSPEEHYERASTASSDPRPRAPGEVYRGLVVEQEPDLLLPPHALPSIAIQTSSSRMQPSRQSYVAAPPRPAESESPVLTLAVHARSDGTQLWRVEKTVAALVLLDTQVKAAGAFRDRLPDKALFAGHSPAKIDARRAALDAYFDRMLDALESERAARAVCRFLSTDALAAAADGGADFPRPTAAAEPRRPDPPVARHRTQRAGYLTKRGKNFGGWKARYFVLDGPQLKYFEAPGGAHMGSIRLQRAQIGKQSNAAASAAPATAPEDEENQFRHAFLVLEPKKKDSGSLVRHVLCAESDAERDAWVEALLQYVDFRDEEEDILKGAQAVRPGGGVVDLGGGGGARSPRLQKSGQDLRPASRTRDPPAAGALAPEAVRVLHYDDTRAGEAPVIGAAGSAARKSATPSPPAGGDATPGPERAPVPLPPPHHHPPISGPSNLHVIANAGDWGMRVPPPTPQRAEHGKDGKDGKKRGMFAAFRGRSSSDLAPSMMSPAFPPGSSDTRGGGGGGGGAGAQRA